MTTTMPMRTVLEVRVTTFRRHERRRRSNEHPAVVATPALPTAGACDGNAGCRGPRNLRGGTRRWCKDELCVGLADGSRVDRGVGKRLPDPVPDGCSHHEVEDVEEDHR